MVATGDHGSNDAPDRGFVFGLCVADLDHFCIPLRSKLLLRKALTTLLLLYAEAQSTQKALTMRNIFYELEFIHDTLQKHLPVAALCGIVVLVLGLIFGRLEMALAGAIVIFVVVVDYVITRVFGNRNPN